MVCIYNCEMEVSGSLELGGQPAYLNRWTPSSLRDLDLKKIRWTSRRYLGWPLNSTCMSIHTHTACIPLPQKSLSKPHFPPTKYIKSEGRGLCALSSRPFSSSVLPVICRAVTCDRAQQNIFSQGSHDKYLQRCEPCPVCHCSTPRHQFILPSHVCALGSTTWLSYNFPGYKNKNKKTKIKTKTKNKTSPPLISF